MKALYHLYRAISVDDPHPRARENLKAKVKKILDQKDTNHLFPQPGQEPSDVLEAQLAYVHASLHAVVNFQDHEKLEGEILTNLSVEMRERPIGDLLLKFTLSNIAAQHIVSNQFTGQFSLLYQ